MMTMTDQGARRVRQALRAAKRLSDNLLARRGEMADALCEHKAGPLSEHLAHAIDIVEAGILASVLVDSAKPSRADAIKGARQNL